MHETTKNFLKGIIVGIGGVAPGLSGSVLLIIFGLYQKTLEALGSLFINFKNKVFSFVCINIITILVRFIFNSIYLRTCS